MERREGAFQKSWLPTLKLVGAGGAITAIGVPAFLAGLSGSNLLLIILGGAAAISGPAMLIALPFMKRGGYGACPACQTSIEALDGSAQNLLCGGCGAYLDVDGLRLVTIPHDRSHDTPFFAAPTPWSDIRGVISSTVALSASDYVSDVITDAIMKDKGARMIEPHWPPGCCVCSAPAVRKETYSTEIRMAGNIRDARAKLVVENVPYCAEHRDGIDFGTVDLASAKHERTFAMRFCSHAFREAFRALNPWRWDTVIDPPATDAAPPPRAQVPPEEKVVIRCPLCSQELRVPSGRRGAIACPACRGRFEAET